MAKKKKKPTYEALDAAVDSLRRLRAKDLQEHAATITAKNRELEEARIGDVLFELSDLLPALPELIHQCRRLNTAAYPYRSPTGDGRSSKTPKTPLDTGASTEHWRSQADEVNKKLREVAAGISATLSPKGPLAEGEIPAYAPICWNPACPSFKHRQGFERLEANGGPGICISCGDPFTAHRPPEDRTEPKDKRCRIRGCPWRDKTNQCIHSWQKAAAT